MSDDSIEDTITSTSKGTFTLPVRIRRLLGIPDKGAKLKIRYIAATKEVLISRPVDFGELQQMTSVHIKKDRKPLTEVSQFYQNRSSKSGDSHE